MFFRYVNSAAFIENNVPLTDLSSDDNIKFSAMSETNSDIVPPLDIKSEENYPTTRDYTFSYRTHCEPAKILHKPDRSFKGTRESKLFQMYALWSNFSSSHELRKSSRVSQTIQ